MIKVRLLFRIMFLHRRCVAQNLAGQNFVFGPQQWRPEQPSRGRKVFLLAFRASFKAALYCVRAPHAQTDRKRCMCFRVSPPHVLSLLVRSRSWDWEKVHLAREAMFDLARRAFFWPLWIAMSRTRRVSSHRVRVWLGEVRGCHGSGELQVRTFRSRRSPW